MATESTKVNLVVLFGGQSAEHDVSCVTAAHVLKAADPERYSITAIGIDRDGGWQIASAAMAALAAGPAALPSRLEAVGEPTSPHPVLSGATAHGALTVVLPLLHGPMGEDGTVQGLLELANVPYVGSGVLGSAVAMDKVMAKTVLAQHGFAQARYRAIREHTYRPGMLEEIIAEFGLPVFVKPANMGSSVGVSKAKTVEELQAALKVAFSYDEWVLVEEPITGREIEVAVLGNLEPRASVPGEIVPGKEFYDYEDKYVDDSATALIPAPLSEEATAEVRELSLAIFSALRCEGLSRVDFFYEETGPARGFLINEVNTIPGFTPISMYPKLWQASGVSYSALIDELVRLAIERHQRQRRNTNR